MLRGYPYLDIILEQSFLTQAIDPPKIEAIDNAWNVLEDLGAVDESGNLTPLGKHIVFYVIFAV